MTKARDPYAHLSGDELLDAQAEWERTHPEEMEQARAEMVGWQAAKLNDLEREAWDGERRAPRAPSRYHD
jgi:hypothetical protein